MVNKGVVMEKQKINWKKVGKNLVEDMKNSPEHWYEKTSKTEKLTHLALLSMTSWLISGQYVSDEKVEVNQLSPNVIMEDITTKTGRGMSMPYGNSIQTYLHAVPNLLAFVGTAQNLLQDPVVSESQRLVVSGEENYECMWYLDNNDLPSVENLKNLESKVEVDGYDLGRRLFMDTDSDVLNEKLSGKVDELRESYLEKCIQIYEQEVN